MTSNFTFAPESVVNTEALHSRWVSRVFSLEFKLERVGYANVSKDGWQCWEKQRGLRRREDKVCLVIKG